jgi:hypothetical protein
VLFADGPLSYTAIPMSIFQFEVQLIPHSGAARFAVSADGHYTDDNVETGFVWDAFPAQIDIETTLSKMLPRGESWNSELTCWGNEKLHDIQLWRDGDRIESISVRLDLRDVVGELLVKLVAVATELQCLLAIPEQQIMLAPNVFTLKKQLMISRAARFLADHEVFRIEGQA